MAKRIPFYLDIYPMKDLYRGAAIAILNNGKSRKSLDLLNAPERTSGFSLEELANENQEENGTCKDPKIVRGDYYRALQKSKNAINIFKKEYYPDSLMNLIKEIESGNEKPTNILTLCKEENRSRLIQSKYGSTLLGRFYLIESTRKENPKDVLIKLLSLCPILLIPREDVKNLSKEKNLDLNELYVYDLLSGKFLTEDSENSFFDKREIRARGNEALSFLQGEYNAKLYNFNRLLEVRAIGDSSGELMKIVNQYQEELKNAKEQIISYQRALGANAEKIKEMEEQNQISEMTKEEIYQKYKQIKQVGQEAALGRIDLDVAEQKMKEIMKIFNPLNGAHIRIYEEKGKEAFKVFHGPADLAQQFAEGKEIDLGEISEGEGKDKISLT